MSPKQPNTAIVPSMPRGFVRVEPDDDRWKCKFHVNSASSDSVYRISYDAAGGAGWWSCSCRGNISHGRCKHLEACGLHPTRAEVMAKRLASPKDNKPTAKPAPRRLGMGRR